MRDNDIKALFEAHPTPAPRGDLADRIADAAPPRAANDTPRWGRWVAAVGAVAASAAFAVFALQPAEPDLQDLAEASGFGELYAWVEGVDG